MRFILVLAALLLWASPGMAAAKEARSGAEGFATGKQQAALTQGPSATVVGVIDGDTVVLGQEISGARQVRLVGIQAPKLPLGRKGFKAWPLAADSKTALGKLVLGKSVRLSFGGTRIDRHRRLLAHLHLTDGRWVQGEMLRLGMARVYTFPDNRALAAEMLGLEREARKTRRGIWDHPFYALRKPQNLARLIGTFQIIEATVVAAAKVKARVYLNFGDDWRSDFTVTLHTKARRMFKKMGLDPLSLQGKRVRVRGWLKKFNGPMIDATHPEQIEVVKQ